MNHIEGHVPVDHPLSPRTAFAQIAPLTRPMIVYRVESMWENDTRKLPRPLRRLRQRIRAFTEREIVPRALLLDSVPHQAVGETNPTIQELLQLAGKFGLLTDLLPRPFGSSPLLGYIYPLAWSYAIRTEELARGCGGLMLLLSAHALGAAPIIFAGNLNAIRRFLLPAFRQSARGEPHLFAYAITEPAGGSDVEDGHGASTYRPGTVARRVNGGWSLSGRKVFISGGDLARSITVFAALAGEGLESWTCFLVTDDMPGFKVVRTELKMGMRASGATELELDEIYVPDDHIIGGLRQGWALNRAVLNSSRIPVAGMAVGLAQGALEAATDFACRLELGGKALIHFQEVQLMLAQMIAEITAMRSLVWHTARKNYAPRQDEASIAKFQATDMGVKVIETAMDLMSNHSLLHANRVEKAYRDARLTQIFEGTNQINRLAIIEDQQEWLLAQIARQRGRADA